MLNIYQTPAPGSQVPPLHGNVLQNLNGILHKKPYPGDNRTFTIMSIEKDRHKNRHIERHRQVDFSIIDLQHVQKARVNGYHEDGRPGGKDGTVDALQGHAIELLLLRIQKEKRLALGRSRRDIVQRIVSGSVLDAGLEWSKAYGQHGEYYQQRGKYLGQVCCRNPLWFRSHE